MCLLATLKWPPPPLECHVLFEWTLISFRFIFPFTQTIIQCRVLSATAVRSSRNKKMIIIIFLFFRIIITQHEIFWPFWSLVIVFSLIMILGFYQPCWLSCYCSFRFLIMTLAKNAGTMQARNFELETIYYSFLNLVVFYNNKKCSHNTF